MRKSLVGLAVKKLMQQIFGELHLLELAEYDVYYYRNVDHGVDFINQRHEELSLIFLYNTYASKNVYRVYKNGKLIYDGIQTLRT